MEPSTPKLSSSLTIKSTRKLNNGVEFPIFGLGTWKSTPKEAYSASLAAVKNGYLHLDTAQFYQSNLLSLPAYYLLDQTFFQDLQKNLPKGLTRKDIFLVSKVFCTDFGYEKTLKAVDRILKECGVEYMDMIILHFPAPDYSKPKDPGNKQNRIDSWRALEKKYKEKKIRSIGVSNYMPNHIQDLLDNCEIIPACNQIEIHPFLTRTDVREFCNKHNIAVVAYSPLAHGKALSDKGLIAIGKKHGKTAAQICIRWVVQAGMVCIPKSTHEKRIIENSDIFDFELTEAEMAEIEKMNKNMHTCWVPDQVV